MLAWASRYGIALDELVQIDLPPPGAHTMSVAEAAQELGLSHEQVRRHLRAGRLRGMPLGGRAGWRVSRADAKRFGALRAALGGRRQPAGFTVGHGDEPIGDHATRLT